MNIDRIVFGDGATVRPTDYGVAAIEKLVRDGRSLEEAVRHIAGGPRMFHDRITASDLLNDLHETTRKDEEQHWSMLLGESDD